jgi:hypothetical protein
VGATDIADRVVLRSAVAGHGPPLVVAHNVATSRVGAEFRDRIAGPVVLIRDRDGARVCEFGE